MQLSSWSSISIYLFAKRFKIESAKLVSMLRLQLPQQTKPGLRGNSIDYAAALLLAAMAAVLLAAVGYQCAATWRWIIGRTRRDSEESNCDSLSRQAAIRISHSLPDLQTEPLKQEYVQEHKDPGKKVSIWIEWTCFTHKLRYFWRN
ncbi:hypothetical protein K1T71_011859 [Dendrolimus kikuchii]|uniref:Uncharacterized protein n=1 Tax=Dendrolimus kikuchii TaxID=765133 RepID=A0ACC1CMJ6_9NEOP|nr:hypothetical protein K1T71_011859 [Dendrolimus kikuchii]